jgi:hypothetical protein
MSQGIFTADFLFSIEKKAVIINERSFLERMSADDMWAMDGVLKPAPFEGKSERVTWVIDSSSIEQMTPANGGEDGGALTSEEMATVTTEYFPAHFGRQFKMGKLKFMNFVQAGINPLAIWSARMGRYGAYMPQRLAAMFILSGETVIGYDGVAFFSASHPVHPLIASQGTYANLFTGAASGSYPGALPIDDSVTLDQAFINLVKGISYIEGAIPAPNGAGDPRMLHVEKILYPPQLQRRVTQLTEMSFYASASAGGAGSADGVKNIWKKFQLAKSQKAVEFDGNRSYSVMNANGTKSTVSGSDTSYYMLAREAGESELGAARLNTRLPFGMQTYSGESGGVEGIDAVLGRSNDIEYHYQGWTAVNPGEPAYLHKFKST